MSLQRTCDLCNMNIIKKSQHTQKVLETQHTYGRIEDIMEILKIISKGHMMDN